MRLKIRVLAIAVALTASTITLSAQDFSNEGFGGMEQGMGGQQGGGMGRGGRGGQMNPENMAKMQVSRLDKAVTLTDEQKVQATTIYQKYGTMMMESRQSGNVDREAMAEQRKAMDTEIKAILTEEQKPAYEKMAAEQPGRRQSNDESREKRKRKKKSDEENEE